jgi:hypothetical protein
LEKNKRREHCSKIEIVLPQKEEGEIEATKKRPDLGEGGRVYVLCSMFVTFPTCQAERLPLKARAALNTAPQQQRKVRMIKMGEKKKGERALYKNSVSAAKKTSQK